MRRDVEPQLYAVLNGATGFVPVDPVEIAELDLDAHFDAVEACPKVKLMHPIQVAAGTPPPELA